MKADLHIIRLLLGNFTLLRSQFNLYVIKIKYSIVSILQLYQFSPRGIIE